MSNKEKRPRSLRMTDEKWDAIKEVKEKSEFGSMGEFIYAMVVGGMKETMLPLIRHELSETNVQLYQIRVQERTLAETPEGKAWRTGRITEMLEQLRILKRMIAGELDGYTIDDFPGKVRSIDGGREVIFDPNDMDEEEQPIWGTKKHGHGGNAERPGDAEGSDEE